MSATASSWQKVRRIVEDRFTNGTGGSNVLPCVHPLTVMDCITDAWGTHSDRGGGDWSENSEC
jgi:hypothetical protein